MSIEFFLGSFLVIIAAIGLPIAFFEGRSSGKKMIMPKLA